MAGLREQNSILKSQIEELEQTNLILSAENKRLVSTASTAKLIVETFKEAAKTAGLSEESHIENLLDRIKFLVKNQKELK